MAAYPDALLNSASAPPPEGVAVPGQKGDRWDSLVARAAQLADACDPVQGEADAAAAAAQREAWAERHAEASAAAARAAVMLEVAGCRTGQLRSLVEEAEAQSAELQEQVAQHGEAGRQAPLFVDTACRILESQQSAELGDLDGRVQRAASSAADSNPLYLTLLGSGTTPLEERSAFLQEVLRLPGEAVCGARLHDGTLCLPGAEGLSLRLRMLAQLAADVAGVAEGCGTPTDYPARSAQLQRLAEVAGRAALQGARVGGLDTLADEALAARVREGVLRETSEMSDRMAQQLQQASDTRASALAKREAASHHLQEQTARASTLEAALRTSESNNQALAKRSTALASQAASQAAAATKLSDAAEASEGRAAALRQGQEVARQEADRALQALQQRRLSEEEALRGDEARLKGLIAENLPVRVAQLGELLQAVERVQQAQVEQQVSGSYSTIEYPQSVEAALVHLRGEAAESPQVASLRAGVEAMRPTLQKYLDAAHERRLEEAQARMQHLTQRISDFHTAAEERQENCRRIEALLQSV